MANDERAIEVAGRAGFVSRAAIWFVTGLLAARLALVGAPEPGTEPDKQGALHLIARQPLGKVLLILLAVGFVAMVVWSITELARKYHGQRANHWSHRAVAAGRGAVYAGLAMSTASVLLEKQSQSGQQEAFTARVLGWPGGRLLIGAVAIALMGAAAFNVYRAVTRRYEKHWDRSRMDERACRIAGPVEFAGNIGHAMVFALVGSFLTMAAVQFDPTKPKSLDESLAALVRQPHGRLMCLTIAAGMVAWALNALAQSRWRKIPADG